MHTYGCVYWCTFLHIPAYIVIYFHNFEAKISFIFSFIISALLHLVPGELILRVISSTSIKVTWTPPPNAEHLPLTYHVGYSSEFTAERSTPTTELSLILTDLHPFDEYTVTVEAENNGGRGHPVVKKATTLTAGICFLHTDNATILEVFQSLMIFQNSIVVVTLPVLRTSCITLFHSYLQ